MRRTIVPGVRCYSEAIAPGVQHERFYPGGKNGPNDEVLMPTPGGQVWSDNFLLGDKDSPFQMLVPDIRLPSNQAWPLHWHDCWTAVILLEGQCLIGDWWMSAGDVFIAEPSLEYGPLVIGPQGARMFEVFAQAHLSPGGYALEYRDHPTLRATSAVFSERSALNRRNEGRQTASCDAPGVSKSRLEPGAQWDLGASGDPDRGVLRDTQLGAGLRLPPHAYGDWRAIMIMDGALQVAGQTLGAEDYLLIRPHAHVPEIVVGAEGARVLEAARTARGLERLA